MLPNRPGKPDKANLRFWAAAGLAETEAVTGTSFDRRCRSSIAQDSIDRTASYCPKFKAFPREKSILEIDLHPPLSCLLNPFPKPLD